MIIALKIIGIALLVGVVSAWLVILIAAAVELGLENYFDKSLRKKRGKTK